MQRLLAAKSLSHAQGATLMAGFIKILPLFMMVMPGMISRIKFPGMCLLQATVNPEIFARILFSRIVLKDIFATLKICN